MKLLSRTYYISAQTSKDGGINPNSHHELGKKLDKLGVSMIDALGSYQGNPELFWLATGDNSMEHEIMLLAKEFNQECVLVVHGNNQDAELVYPDGSRKMLGTMVCLGPDEGSLKGRDYAYVNGNFYIVEVK